MSDYKLKNEWESFYICTRSFFKQDGMEENHSCILIEVPSNLLT